MARFLGTAAGRASGGGGGGGLFTKAKVFTNAGSTTYDVPSGTKHVKVFVVGAGSCYRPGTYCFNSENCCSGVNNPRRWYRACFCGHLTGAGGGYAEKTWTAKDDQIGGKQLTVTVGAQGGLSSSSVDATGINAVTAANATDSSYSWACTSNSTARDNSNDNPIEGGFQLPVCGYQNSFSGYTNAGGTASGGDINRTGGDGTIVPEFLYDSCMDAYSQDISGGPPPGGGGGGTNNCNSCWVNPQICCMCWRSYHTVFGSNCQWQAWCCTNCTCYYLCTYISSLCTGGGGGSSGIGGQARKEISFYYRGKYHQEGCYKSSCSIRGRFDNYSLGTTGAPRTAPEGSSIGYELDDTMAHVVPKGIGASSGYSAGDGSEGRSEGIFADVTPYNTMARCEIAANSTNANEMTIQCGRNFSYGYDYVFGGSSVGCVCYCYFPGSFSAANNITASGTNYSTCYHCAGFGWNYVYGGSNSNQAMCWMMPYGAAGAQTGSDDQDFQPTDRDCVYRTCYNMSYLHDTEAGKVDTYTIPLSTLLNADTDGNQEDVEYGRGATLISAALPGGGGNKEYPTGGSGMVVLVYG